MTISAIIVTYHTGIGVLGNCLDALVEDEDIHEIIIVDNGNTEQDQAYLRELEVKEPKVRFVEYVHNNGFGGGCNRGARLARGRYLLFLNPDAVLEPGAARKLVAAGVQTGGMWLTGGRLMNEAGTQEQRGSRRGRFSIGSLGAALIRLHAWPFIGRYVRPLDRSQEPVPPAPESVPVVSGACMLMPKEAFLEIGGFDEGYFLHMEDVDLCRRVEKHQKDAVIFVPDARVRHLGSSSNISRYKVERFKARGFFRYFWKHSVGVLDKLGILLIYPVIWVLSILRAWQRTLRHSATNNR